MDFDPRPRVELPTLLLAAALYLAWLALTWSYHRLPWWLVLSAGGCLLALHGSLQHEAIHGHPTRSRRLNGIIAGAPLGLWLPFGVYRQLHLAHHRCPELTDPLSDPESHYVQSKLWERSGPMARALRWANATLLGRMLLGPWLMIGATWRDEILRLSRGDRSRLASWAWHGAASALLLFWVMAVCDIPLPAYLALFVYPGLALTTLRSFAEHRPAKETAHRTAIVEAHPFWGLLFLHNNLHALHHAHPGLPWYALPDRYRRQRQELLSGNGGYLIEGYAALLRYLVRPKDPPRYPEP